MNKTLKKILITIPIILLLIYFFLRGHEINLEKQLVYEKYENLPLKVQLKYAEVLNNKDTTKIFSLDKNYTVKYYWTGMHKKLLLKGFREHVIINDKHKFKLDANKGEPYILHEKTLYLPVDLNFSALSNANQTRYYKINLSKYLR